MKAIQYVFVNNIWRGRRCECVCGLKSCLHISVLALWVTGLWLVSADNWALISYSILSHNVTKVCILATMPCAAEVDEGEQSP